MAAAPYTWKSTQELQQRNQANTMAKAMQRGTGTPAPSAAPAPRPSLPAPGAPAPSPGVTAFAVPKTTAEAMRRGATLESNMGLAQENIAAGFKPAAPGPADDLARNEFQKTLDANQRATLEQSALSGRMRTGQIGGDLVNFLTQSAIPAKADLEAGLQANRMKEDTNRAQSAQANLLNLANLDQSGTLAREQMGLTERTSMADIASREKLGLAGIASQEGMQARDIASKEKLGFADLSVREKQLAQEGAQFKDELAFKKYATDRGFTDAEAARVWQSKENALEIASREKVSFAQLSQADKELAQKAAQFTDQLAWEKEATKLGLDDKAAERIWQAGENLKERESRASESALSRELQKYLEEKKLDLDDRQLAENIRQFDSKQDFDRWATQAGLDNEAAARIWKSNEDDVARKWSTGERLGAEQATINLERLRTEADTAKMQFGQLLNIQTMEKQAEIDQVTAATANAYQTARDTRMMSHDEAMEVMKSGLAAQLQKMGYDQQTALQAAELQATAYQKDQDRQAAQVEAQAELAYKYKALADQSGLSQQEIALRGKELEQNLALSLKQMGLDERRIEAAITSDQFKDRQGVIATMMELGGDDPAVMDRAAAAFLNLLADPSLPGGALVSPEDKVTMLAAIGKAPAASKPGEWSTDNSFKDTISGVDNLSKGNILTGAGQLASGAVGLPISVSKDAVHGIATGVRKVGDWLGF